MESLLIPTKRHHVCCIDGWNNMPMYVSSWWNMISSKSQLLRGRNYFYFPSMLTVFANNHIILLYRTLVQLCQPSQKCVSTALEITAHTSVVLCRETTLSALTILFLGKTTLSVSHWGMILERVERVLLNYMVRWNSSIMDVHGYILLTLCL